MCGIAGIIGKTTLQIDKMSEMIAHRGPDGFGIWKNTSADVFLAHRRLAIIDIETGMQPMMSQDGRYVLVFNGEIYNFQELKKELQTKGCIFLTHSDTEVLLQGYALYGIDIVKKLDGMFAFGIWDTVEHELVLARDRLGMKPLFYRLEANGLAFASEAKALLSEKREIDVESFSDFLHLGFRTQNRTLFKNIVELPPATWVTYRPNTSVACEPKKYWDLPSGSEIHGELEENALQIRDVLGRASTSHLVSDVPLGFWLSGGLDSSIILQCAKEHIPENSRIAYTLAYGFPNDEAPYAKHMAELAHVKWECLTKNLEDAKTFLVDLIWHLEEPLPNVTSISTYFLAKAMKNKSKVVLIGEGADELFGGYPHYMPFTGTWNLLPSPIRDWACNRGYLMPSEHVLNKIAPFRKDFIHAKMSTRRNLDQALRFDVRHELVQNQLARIDRLTMAHGVEARVPFLDHHVVEAAFRIPDWQKRVNNQTKIILRHAFQKELPEAIISRPKFGSKGTQRISKYLYDRVIHGLSQKLLTRDRLGILGFDPDATKRFLCYTPHDYYHEAILHKTTYFLVVFDIWHRLFLEKESIEHIYEAILL